MLQVTPPKQVNFIDFSLAAFAKWMQTTFAEYDDKPLTYSTVSGPAALRQLSPKLEAPDKQQTGYLNKSKLVYPYLLSAIGDISLDGERNGYNRRAYHNLLAGKDMNRNVGLAYTLRPVNVGLGLVFNTDNLSSLLAFSSAIIMNSPAVTVILEGEGGLEIGIKIVFDPNITIPSVNYETPGEAYQFNTVVALKTYLGTFNEIRLITGIRVRTIDINSQEKDLYTGTGEELYSQVIKFTDQFK